MLISNIQDNLAKCPMVAAAQSAQDEHAKTENTVRRNEALDLARKAEEEVRDVKQSENEAIKDEQELVRKINPEEEKKKPPPRPRQKPPEEEPSQEVTTEGKAPLTPYHDGQPHIDLQA
ncbi:MAG: hypothetical protein JXA52_02940 [Planctomycetes bacterium]|nr:hypothetical protein [Planctomycetota bacterium]